MPALARLVLVLGLVLPAAGCNRKKGDGPDAGGGLLGGGGKKPDLAALRAERPLPPFKAVALDLRDATAEVTVGEKYAVTVEADDETLPHLQAEVVNDQLELGLLPDVVMTGRPTPVRFKVVAPRLAAARAGLGGRIRLAEMAGDVVRVEIGTDGQVTVGRAVAARQLDVVMGTGTADVTAEAPAAVVEGNHGSLTLKGTFRQQLGLTLSSVAKVTAAVTATTVVAKVSGSAELDLSGDLGAVALGVEGDGGVKVSGPLGTLRASLAGSGHLTADGSASAVALDAVGSGKADAGGLRAEAVSVKAASAAELTVWATGTLTVTDDYGQPTVRYKGRPRVDRQGEGRNLKLVPLGE